MCLEGEEQKRANQYCLYDHLNNLLLFLRTAYNANLEEPTETAISLIKLFFSDGNYLDYNSSLADLYAFKAKRLCNAGQIAEAEEALRNAYMCAKDFDAIEGKYIYTAPFFDLVSFDTANRCLTGQTTVVEDLKNMLDHPSCAKVKALDAYKELFEQ